MIRRAVVSCGVWLLTAPAAFGQPDGRPDAASPSPLDLQAECLRYRDETTRDGRVFLKSVTEDAQGRTEAEYRIWFTPARLRFDIRNLRDGAWGEWEHYVVEEGRYTWVPEGEFEGVIAPSQEYAGEQGGVMGHFSLFHPRWLGMGQNSESLMHREPNSRFVDPQIKKAEHDVAEDRVGEFRAWRVTRKTSFPGATPDAPQTPGEFVMWFAPDAGMSLLRAELRELGQTTLVRSVESRLEQFAVTDAWYPRTVTRETVTGGRVDQRQVITVQEAVLGEPPADEEFGVGAMGLSSGKQISDRSQGPSETVLVWDGKATVPVRGPDVMPMDPPTPGPGGRSTMFWVLVTNAALLAGIGFACIARWYFAKT